MGMESLSIGEMIKFLRHERNLKLIAVSRRVPASTLNAVEKGVMIPSPSLLDKLTHAFELPDGALDLICLRSVRHAHYREQLVERLSSNPRVTDVEIQQVLRECSVRKSPDKAHATLLLAQLLARRRAFGRAVVVLNDVYRNDRTLRGFLRLRLLNTLGKYCLIVNRPTMALEPLLEAVRLKPFNDVWESAMTNLGLVWWKLGHYERARLQWVEAMARVKNPMRQAHTLMGLGNTTLRESNFEAAQSYFGQALQIYQRVEATTDARLGALNNLLVCYVFLHDWNNADRLIHDSMEMTKGSVSRIMHGQFLATQAGAAFARQDRAQALRLIKEAKEAIGITPILSWFSIRLLQLSLMDFPHGDEKTKSLFDDLASQSRHLHDAQLTSAVQLRLALIALNNNDVETAEGLIKRCVALLPLTRATVAAEVDPPVSDGTPLSTVLKT